jgi:hypothetical protein
VAGVLRSETLQRWTWTLKHFRFSKNSFLANPKALFSCAFRNGASLKTRKIGFRFLSTISNLWKEWTWGD